MEALGSTSRGLPVSVEHPQPDGRRMVGRQSDVEELLLQQRRGRLAGQGIEQPYPYPARGGPLDPAAHAAGPPATDAIGNDLLERYGHAGYPLARDPESQVKRLSDGRRPRDGQALDDPLDGDGPGHSARGRFCVSEDRQQPYVHRSFWRANSSCGPAAEPNRDGGSRRVNNLRGNYILAGAARQFAWLHD